MFIVQFRAEVEKICRGLSYLRIMYVMQEHIKVYQLTTFKTTQNMYKISLDLCVVWFAI